MSKRIAVPRTVKINGLAWAMKGFQAVPSRAERKLEKERRKLEAAKRREAQDD